MRFNNKMVLLTIFFYLIILSASIVSANAITTMETNLQMNISDIVLLVVTLGLIVFTVLDVRIAVMLGLLLYTSIFVLYTVLTELGYTGYNAYFPGVAMMLCIVLLCLMLLISYKKSNTVYKVP